jgi:hypothetical protein
MRRTGHSDRRSTRGRCPRYLAIFPWTLQLAHTYGGRPVKLLGDGVMFYFPEPGQAVRCGLEPVDRSPGSACPRPGSACTAARWSSRAATTSAAPSTSRPGSPTTPDRGRSWSATRSSPTPTLWRRSALSLSGPSRPPGPRDVVLAGRATTVPFTAVLTGPRRTIMDNATATSTGAVPCRRRSRSCPIWLCKQGVDVADTAIELSQARHSEHNRKAGSREPQR